MSGTHDDITLFFDTDHGAVTALVGGAHSVVGYFYDEYAGELEIEGTAPAFECATADMTAASAKVGSTFVISGTNYIAQSLHQDGTGVTVVLLDKAA